MWFFLLYTLMARASQPDPTPLDGLLEDHVRDGRVDYPALCDDHRLVRWLDDAATTDPNTLPGRAARFAFYVNLYNATTLRLICDHRPLESISSLHAGGLFLATLLHRTAWDRPVVHVGGETLSLNQVEHLVLRRQFDDPRVHFALVCASRSCPPLRSEAYVASRLDEQLDDQGRRFLARSPDNVFDPATKTAILSPIFRWYGGDFSNGPRGLLSALAPYAPVEVRDDLGRGATGWRVRWSTYDWHLNDSSRRTRVPHSSDRIVP